MDSPSTTPAIPTHAPAHPTHSRLSFLFRRPPPRPSLHTSSSFSATSLDRDLDNPDAVLDISAADTRTDDPEEHHRRVLRDEAARSIGMTAFPATTPTPKTSHEDKESRREGSFLNVADDGPNRLTKQHRRISLTSFLSPSPPRKKTDKSGPPTIKPKSIPNGSQHSLIRTHSSHSRHSRIPNPASSQDQSIPPFPCSLSSLPAQRYASTIHIVPPNTSFSFNPFARRLKPRYLYLTPSHLHMFPSSKPKEREIERLEIGPSGRIHAVVGSGEEHFMLSVEGTAKSLTFACPGRKEMSEWIRSVEDAVESKKPQRPTRSAFQLLTTALPSPDLSYPSFASSTRDLSTPRALSPIMDASPAQSPRPPTQYSQPPTPKTPQTARTASTARRPSTAPSFKSFVSPRPEEWEVTMEERRAREMRMSSPPPPTTTTIHPPPSRGPQSQSSPPLNIPISISETTSLNSPPTSIADLPDAPMRPSRSSSSKPSTNDSLPPPRRPRPGSAQPLGTAPGAVGGLEQDWKQSIWGEAWSLSQAQVYQQHQQTRHLPTPHPSHAANLPPPSRPRFLDSNANSAPQRRRPATAPAAGTGTQSNRTSIMNGTGTTAAQRRKSGAPLPPLSPPPVGPPPAPPTLEEQKERRRASVQPIGTSGQHSQDGRRQRPASLRPLPAIPAGQQAPAAAGGVIGLGIAMPLSGSAGSQDARRRPSPSTQSPSGASTIVPSSSDLTSLQKHLSLPVNFAAANLPSLSSLATATAPSSCPPTPPSKTTARKNSVPLLQLNEVRPSPSPAPPKDPAEPESFFDALSTAAPTPDFEPGTDWGGTSPRASSYVIDPREGEEATLSLDKTVEEAVAVGKERRVKEKDSGVLGREKEVNVRDSAALPQVMA